jgi:hypothetical protein
VANVVATINTVHLEQSACAARVALQTGCMANVVATINGVISLSSHLVTFLSEGVDGCVDAEVRVPDKIVDVTWPKVKLPGG